MQDAMEPEFYSLANRHVPSEDLTYALIVAVFGSIDLPTQWHAMGPLIHEGSGSDLISGAWNPMLQINCEQSLEKVQNSNIVL